jgi:hypothetical protein
VTTQGGSWRWLYNEPRVLDPVEFQAQWNNQYSRTLLARTPIHARLTAKGRVLRLSVETSYSGQSMNGRAVELQRRAGSRWVRIASRRLARVRDHRYEARFRVRSRGLTLRGFVPAASAKRCYLATATRAITS